MKPEEMIDLALTVCKFLILLGLFLYLMDKNSYHEH